MSKTLAISLLRFGDIFQHLLLLKQSGRLELSQTTFLVFTEFSGCREVLSHYGCDVVCLDRITLGVRGNNDFEFSLETNQALNDWVQSFSAQESFDSVLNLSHTKLSGFIAGKLAGAKVKGLHFANNRWSSLDHYAQTYFDTRFSGNTKAELHYVEALALSLGFALPKPMSVRLPSQAKLICLQTETSDDKKNWPLQNFQQLVLQLKKIYPESQIQIFCTQNQKDKLVNYFAESDLLVCSFFEAHQLLKNADLLITLDTSMLHLAALAECPTLEIAVGSADPIKTGAFQMGASVVQSEVSCFPCKHSSKCPYSEYLCQTGITVQQVLSKTQSLLTLQQSSLVQDSLSRRVALYLAGVKKISFTENDRMAIKEVLESLEQKLMILEDGNFSERFKILIQSLSEESTLNVLLQDQRLIFTKKYQSISEIQTAWKQLIDSQMQLCHQIYHSIFLNQEPQEVSI